MCDANTEKELERVLPVYVDAERKEKLALLERNTHEEDEANLEGALTLSQRKRIQN